MDISNQKSEPLFNLQQNIDSWIDKIKVEPSITEADIEELRSHFLDIIDDLKEKGLDEEEAFLVASKRMRFSDDLTNEYRQENNSIYQMQRSLIILGGILLYFLIYTFIMSSYNILFITSYSLSDSDGVFALDLIKKYLIGWHFIIVIFLISIFFLEQKTISLIAKIRLKPIHTIFILLIIGIFHITDMFSQSIIKRLISENHYLTSKYIHFSRDVGISFPLLLCVGFVFIYYKYYRKTKI